MFNPIPGMAQLVVASMFGMKPAKHKEAKPKAKQAETLAILVPLPTVMPGTLPMLPGR